MGSVEHKPLTFSNSKRWFVVSLSLCAMIYTGSKALQMLSVPVFTIFKNLTIIITAYSERAWFNGSKITRVILLSFWLMIASSAISGWNDITSGNILKGNASIVTSYLWMAANCFTTAFFSLMMRFKIKDIGFKDFDTVYYNNILSIPVLLALSWLTERDLYGETIDIIANDTAGGLSFAIALTGVTAFFISYCSGWCVRVTSSTTLSMVGALNKLPIAVFGMLLFDDVFTFSGAMGIVLMFFGGVLYAKGKADQANSIKRETVEKSVKMTSDEKITVVVDDTKQV